MKAITTFGAKDLRIEDRAEARENDYVGAFRLGSKVVCTLVRERIDVGSTRSTEVQPRF
ncbi:hypothetical protein [Devosia sp. A449]